MKVKGIIETIFEPRMFGPTYKKREFVIKVNDIYPQLISMETEYEKCEILDNFKKGDKVFVDFELRGREWTNPEGKTMYFNSLRVSSILKLTDEFQKFNKLEVGHFLMEINKNKN